MKICRMKTVLLLFISLISASLAVSMSAISKDNHPQSISLEAKNMKQITDNLISAGQPTEEDLKKLKANDFSHVINLRPASENIPFDEANTSKELGLKYSNLPIAGPADINKDNALKLDALLKQSDEKVLLHCGSANRVGALLALREFYVNGKSAEQALEYGRNAGLTSLEGKVKQVLDEGKK